MIYKFREGNLSDLSEIVGLCIQFCRDEGWAFDSKRIIRLVSGYVGQENKTVQVCQFEGQIVGVFMAYLDHDLWTGDAFVQDRICFITEGHRVGYPAEELYHRVARWAQERGAKTLYMFAASHLNKDKLARVMNRLGCKIKGHLLEKRLV